MCYLDIFSSYYANEAFVIEESWSIHFVDSLSLNFQSTNLSCLTEP